MYKTCSRPRNRKHLSVLSARLTYNLNYSLQIRDRMFYSTFSSAAVLAFTHSVLAVPSFEKIQHAKVTLDMEQRATVPVPGGSQLGKTNILNCGRHIHCESSNN